MVHRNFSRDETGRIPIVLQEELKGPVGSRPGNIF
jgi:hypothetical protein